jgi:hypothetical protein
MPLTTYTFLTSTTWAFTGSILGGSPTSSATASYAVLGAGGHGHKDGRGGSGGGYAEAGAGYNSTIMLQSGSVLYICVGQATATDGGTSSIATGSSVPYVRAAGGKMDGTVTHQATLQTGSYTTVLGSVGGANFQGYDNYAGGGGGAAGNSSGVVGTPGLSGFYATREGGAPGGKVANAAPLFGGSGSFYLAGANQNRVVSAGGGDYGCGGGGGYDYPASVDSSGPGGNGAAYVTLYS